MIWGLARVAFVALVWFALAGARASAGDPLKLRETAERGTDWLVTQQGADGGWHSETYGAYRSGVGTTAVAVRALARDRSPRVQTSVERGLAFLTSRCDERGFVVAPDGSSDNAMYATALTAAVLQNRDAHKSGDVHQRLLQALADAQYLDPGAPDTGGWASFITALDGVGRETPANVSATVTVLEARPTLKDRAAAVGFINRCRNIGRGTHGDGGFFFTPHLDHPLNKMSDAALPSGTAFPVSYFSATCDGIVALSFLQVPTSPEERRRQIQSLEALPRPRLLASAPGADSAPPSPLDGLYFYSAAAFGEVWIRFPREHARLEPIRNEMLMTIIARQHPAGDWANPVSTMREDDPLIATSLALIALYRLAIQPSHRR